METSPDDLPTPPPLDYEPRAVRPRRTFFTPGGWFLLSSFCTVYLLIGTFARRPGAYRLGEWIFMTFMVLAIGATLALGVRATRRSAKKDGDKPSR